MKRLSPYRISSLVAILLAAAGAGPALAQLPEAGEPDGYGYFRTVEGDIRLTTFDQGEPIDVEPNYPVLTGDRIWVSPDGRVELVLPDRSVIRAGSATDLYLDTLALSADAEEYASTAMNLVEGEIVVTVNDFFEELEPTVIDTGHAAIYLQSAGTYRIRADNGVYTQVVVRDGFAEIHTERGSVVVRSGEEAELDGTGAPRVGLGTAARLSDLELWGQELDGVAYASSGSPARSYGGGGGYGGYVDPSLAYAAAPLSSHGTWVSVSGRTAWRPHVGSSWRPFSNGWWVYTPSGLSWVSYEPFGWVTSHYGSWAYTPGWGWLWHPGAVYSPAWVYWYWGPTHVAWVPVGYYSHHYAGGWGGWGSWGGFRFGVYGWAGGSWDYFSHWTFCPARYFGRRGYHSYWRAGYEQRHHGGLRAVPRGVITADTRPISPSRWGKPAEIVDSLTRADQLKADRLRAYAGLPDVTNFVARRNDLSEAVQERVFTRRLRDAADRGASDRLAGRRDGGSVASAPWRLERPLPDGGVDRDQLMRDRVNRDAEVSRGARIGDLRRSLVDTERQSPAASRTFERPGGSGVERSPSVLEREIPDRFRGGQGLLRPEMPPSGRVASPRSSLTPSDGAEASGRLPIVRRILEGIRSGETPSRTPSERTPTSRGDGGTSSIRDGGSSSPSASRPSPSARPESSATERRPTTRSSSPPSRSESAGSSSRSPSRRSESVRSAPSRSRSSAAPSRSSSSSSRSKSARKKDGRP